MAGDQAVEDRVQPMTLTKDCCGRREPAKPTLAGQMPNKSRRKRSAGDPGGAASGRHSPARVVRWEKLAGTTWQGRGKSHWSFTKKDDERYWLELASFAGH